MSPWDSIRPVSVLALWTMRESVRRRVFTVVGLLTLGFVVLFALGCSVAFGDLRHVRPDGPLDARDLVGATLCGLGMFAILFLGCVLAAFLTLSAVRGDAEQGLLQPLVVRPVGRPQVLAARWLAAVGVCAAYCAAVYVVVLLVLNVTGDWRPDHVVGPGVRLVAAVAVLAALCVLGSVAMTTIANGIATFMVLGAGMFAGLLGQVGRGLRNDSLTHAAHVISWALPFEALYQDGLAATTSAHGGLTRFLVSLGPFGGGAAGGRGLLAYVVAYLAVVACVTTYAASRRDL